MDFNQLPHEWWVSVVLTSTVLISIGILLGAGAVLFAQWVI